jgi:hypothetical protein
LALVALRIAAPAEDESSLRPARRSLSGAIAAAALGAIMLLMPVSCGDDGTTPPSGGTPPGSYQMTVTASWESVQATTTATMVVQ